MNISQMKYYKQQKGYSFAKLSELPRIYGAADDIPVGIYEGELTVSAGEIFEQARGIGE